MASFPWGVHAWKIYRAVIATSARQLGPGSHLGNGRTGLAWHENAPARELSHDNLNLPPKRQLRGPHVAGRRQMATSGLSPLIGEDTTFPVRIGP